MTTEKNELSPSVRERIRKEAEERYKITDWYMDETMETRLKKEGYIAGAESEHPKAIAAYRESLKLKVLVRQQEVNAGYGYNREAEISRLSSDQMCRWFLFLVDQS